MRLALIGGTGVYDPAMLSDLREVNVTTPYGAVTLTCGQVGGEEVAFLNRHGKGHALPPHRVNYRANIWALRELGVERVLATAAVGSLRKSLPPGAMVLADQFLDFTKGRTSTFYEGEGAGLVHVDVTDPYCPELRQLLASVGKERGVPVIAGGTYVCTEGPRFESAAEIRMYAQLGGDLVGMTNVPEVVLARELGLCYTVIAMVTNFAAGISPVRLTHSEVTQVMAENSANLRTLTMAALTRIPLARGCDCGQLPEIHGLSEAQHG